MRLWHRDMIHHLPKQQLLGQWRELCCIAALLAKEHTPNHILVNPILDYPPEHFEAYCNLVIKEMTSRNFEIHPKTLTDLKLNIRAWRLYLDVEVPFDFVDEDWELHMDEDIFGAWHNTRYLKQCYYNLEEKYDRGGVPHDEWLIIFANFGE